MKVKMNGKIVTQEQIGTGIFSLRLQARGDRGEKPGPGSLYPCTAATAAACCLVPSACVRSMMRQGRLRLVYRIAGKGTEEFSRLRQGDTIEVMGPLGNGFPLEEARGRKVLLMGGGIGIPPMLETARSISGEKQIILGYRDERFLEEEFRKEGTVYVATEDGSAGTRATCWTPSGKRS